MKSPTTPDLMPRLSAGRHRTPRQGACFMEFASYLAGERWSDHPSCTHPLLAALARGVNDLTSDAARDRLHALIHRVIGLNTDDPRLQADIAVRAASAALPIANLERQRALAAGLLTALTTTDSPDLRTVAAQAFAQAPDAERWARRYLATTATIPRDFGWRAAEAIVHTSTVGIALACVDDADERLYRLLDEAITAAESIVAIAGAGPVAVPTRGALQPA